MCGICGVMQVDGESRAPVGQDVLDRMTDAMVHRGPNDRGTYAAPGVVLGARRLSIVDVEGGHQPFANEDGHVWAVQNGELYNHGEIRAALRRDGHRFASRCDTEILPHLYERDGTAVAEQLRGKFAVAVWDERRRRGVVARDRLGIKPLYYARVGDVVVFASELKSVLASGLVSGELDLEALDAYLTLGFVPGPMTPLRDVRKLLPGEQLVVEPGRFRLERYWRYPVPEPRAGRSVELEVEELLEVLEESVRLRLMSDVPLGAMLSGGLDSSLIVALMARHTTGSVKTFSVGFEEAGAENELDDARFVAGVFGTEHHELELSFARQDVELRDLTWYMDEPVADLSALGFLALSKLAAETVTVALSGQGADELLGGYSRHRNAQLAARVLGMPAAVRTGVLAAARLAPGRLDGVTGVVRAPDAVARQLAAFAGVSSGGVRLRGLDGGNGTFAAAAVAERLGGLTADPLATMLFLDGQLGLVDDMLHYFDRTSMAYSLEVRVPFLDHVVVEHCARIPAALKVKGATTKFLLKRAARGIVPDRIIDKPKVGFFNAAVDAWFRAQTDGAISAYLLDERPAYAELIDRDQIVGLVAEHAAGRVNGRALLPVLMLEVWLRDFLPRALASRRPDRERIELAS
jgi:asparagine synthase (glutamine-hydrolysing)